MDCRTTQRMIESFIDNKMSQDELAEFLDHIKNCQNCYDELEVYYIITKGVRLLDENQMKNFNLTKMMKDEICLKYEYLDTISKKKLRRSKIRNLILVSFLVVMMGVLQIFMSYDDKISNIDEMKHAILMSFDFNNKENTIQIDPEIRRRNFELRYPLIPSYAYIRNLEVTK